MTTTMTKMTPDLNELLDGACEAARLGGRHALRNIARRHDVVRTYAHDVKLALDRECQEQIAAYLAKRFPTHGLLGEEDRPDETRRAQSEFEWIVDPIDGTVNFTHGLPMWCCSVAVRRGEEMLAGAVFVPEFDELYAGARGCPSTCNNTPLHVSQTPTLDLALVMTGMDKRLEPNMPPFAIFSAIALHTQKTRIAGSAAVDLCWVAAGKADGYFEGRIYAWDISAAKVIIKGAGGRCETLSRREEPHQVGFLATNGRIHAALKTLLIETGVRYEPGTRIFDD
jgi:myo-inositol-1(or 4)-monophosphatase